MTKLLTLQDAMRIAGRRVFTNGMFDILHVGHVRYLQAARMLGDCLIVGLNGDVSVRAHKGERRPIVPQAERAEMLAALSCVDYIIVFDALTAESIVATLKPEVYVKGGDYGSEKSTQRDREEKIAPEAKVVEAYGGQVVYIPFIAGKSTTNIISEILRRYTS